MSTNNSIGACIWSLPGDNPLAFAAEAGLEGVELDMGQGDGRLPLDNRDRQDALREEAGRFGLQFPSLGCNVFCGLSLCRSETAGRVESLLERIVATADRMGIPLLQVPSFVASRIDGDEDLNRTAGHFRRLCSLAESAGILVGTENALSVEDNLKLAELVDHDNFRCYFDISNPPWMAGIAAPDMIEPLFSRICEVHLKDQFRDGEGNVRFAELGMGGSDFAGSMGELKRLGYDKWIILENDYSAPGKTRGSGSPLDILKKDTASVRDLILSI